MPGQAAGMRAPAEGCARTLQHPARVDSLPAQADPLPESSVRTPKVRTARFIYIHPITLRLTCLLSFRELRPLATARFRLRAPPVGLTAGAVLFLRNPTSSAVSLA